MNNKDNEETMIFTPVDKKADSGEKALDDYIEEELMSREEPEEKGNKALIYTLVILSILLVMAIIAVFLLLSSGKSEKGEMPGTGGDIVIEEKEPSEEKEAEKEVKIISCSVIFYGESAVENRDGYVITAKVTDNNTQRQKKKHLLIDDDTEIRINGKRVAADSFIYLLEEKNEENLVFDAKVEEETEYITYISYNGNLSEKEEEQEEIPAEETEEKPEEEEIIEGINLQE